MDYLLILIFILAPTYALRFNLFHFPTNVLMLAVFLLWAIFFVWLFTKNQFTNYLEYRKNISPKILILTGLFFVAGIISLFVGGIDRAKLGQFIVLFLQPISVFFMAGFIFYQNPKAKSYILLTTYYFLALSGLYAILQYFTLIGLPADWWGNSVEPKRALSFFVHPNFYALWSAPLLALLIPDLGLKIKDLRKNWLIIASWIIGAIGLLLSFSRAGWLGLAAAVLVYLIVAADAKIRKIIFGTAIVLGVIVLAVPNLRWRLILPFYGERSADSRIELWQAGWKGIEQSPIFGLGINGFANEYRTLQTDSTLPDHNFPHNIFFDLWVETGLLGLISFIGIAYIFIQNGLKNRADILKLGACLFLVAIMFQGQIDNPYFKNDLALVFWISLTLV